MYGSDPRRGGGGPPGGVRFFSGVLQKFTGPLLGKFIYIGILSSRPQLKTSRLAPFLEQIGLRGGPVDMSKIQRHTRTGAGRGVSQANEAAIYPKLTELRQHEIVSGILKKLKQCGTVQASYGCLVGHVCMGVCISVFVP